MITSQDGHRKPANRNGHEHEFARIIEYIKNITIKDVAIPVCGRFGLWPFDNVVYGRFDTWTLRMWPECQQSSIHPDEIKVMPNMFFPLYQPP